MKWVVCFAVLVITVSWEYCWVPGGSIAVLLMREIKQKFCEAGDKFPLRMRVYTSNSAPSDWSTWKSKVGEYPVNCDKLIWRCSCQLTCTANWVNDSNFSLMELYGNRVHSARSLHSSGFTQSGELPIDDVNIESNRKWMSIHVANLGIKSVTKSEKQNETWKWKTIDFQF